MDLTNEAVLKTIEQEVLHPEVVQRALRRVLDELNAPTEQWSLVERASRRSSRCWSRSSPG